MTIHSEIYRGIAVAAILSTVFAMVVAPALALSADISVAMKHTKKVTLVAIKNNSDEPVYGVKISFEDGIKFVKARDWDRGRIDQDTVMVTTDEKPLEPGRTLITLLIVNNKEAGFGWSALDEGGKVLAGTMVESQNAIQQPLPEPKKEEKPSKFQPSKLSSKVTLNGAGATFPFPLLDKWRAEYNKINSMVDVNYQSIGSGGGVKQFVSKTVDFGASDAPLTEEQFKTLKNPIQIPETIGAVTVTYNLPGLDGKPIGSGLKMTPDIVADIFLGKIKKWNDIRIATLNPEALLPDESIIVAHRSDGSGTTFVFTDYLDTVSKEWHEKVGKDKAVQWPIGVGAAGNEGVAGVVRSTKYAAGYVELAYAIQTNMPVAAVQNLEGEFVLPSLESTKAAAGNAAEKLPKPWEDWSQVSIVDASGKGSYPIASFTYLLLYQELGDVPGMTQDKAQALIDFLWWAIHDGQQYSPDLHYVPLPDEVIEMSTEAIKKLTFQGKSLNIPG
jgi:phosphate ABC transporter phosphate-binding protein